MISKWSRRFPRRRCGFVLRACIPDAPEHPGCFYFAGCAFSPLVACRTAALGSNDDDVMDHYQQQFSAVPAADDEEEHDENAPALHPAARGDIRE